MENNQKFCQSCSMPLATEDQYGTEADGKRSADYCSYCYENGKFKAEMTMEAMIDFCVPYMLEQFGGDKEKAKQAMMGFFPQLKRWAAAQ